MENLTNKETKEISDAIIRAFSKSNKALKRVARIFSMCFEDGIKDSETWFKSLPKERRRGVIFMAYLQEMGKDKDTRENFPTPELRNKI